MPSGDIRESAVLMLIDIVVKTKNRKLHFALIAKEFCSPDDCAKGDITCHSTFPWKSTVIGVISNNTL